MFPIIPPVYFCKECDVTCSKTNDWNRHLLTAKHKKNTSSDNIISKVSAVYSCEKCDYKCYKQSLWDKHIATAKHKKQSISESEISEIPSKLCCDKCNKTYKCYSSLWSHKRNCNPDKSNELINKLLEKNTELLEKNTELQNFILEQTRQNQIEYKQSQTEYKNDINQIMMKIVESMKSTTNTITANTINNNNQKFNINVFLNEQCKDAINFSDFIKNIEVSREDLENNAQLGFVGGISKILLDNLRQLSINERPIHCTDAKRGTMYIKDDNKRTKEEDCKKLNSAIQTMTQKSTRTLLDWKKENPDYNDHDSEFSNKCIVIQKNSMAGYDRETYYPKVIKAIAKEVTV